MQTCSSAQRADLLKDAIFQLYSKEGRSKSAISRLLSINRRTLSQKIAQWGFPEAEPRRHLTPSSQKFLRANRSYIKSRLDRDCPVSQIARELGASRDFLQKTIIPHDPVLSKAHEDAMQRLHSGAQRRRERIMEASRLAYDFADLPGELWRPVLGYEGYEVSNMGRIKRLAERYETYYLLRPEPNARNGRLYVMLYSGGKRKNLQLANLVAHTFVPGYDRENCTVNHKDGNVQNNAASNLEWVSQGQNNLHAYRSLGRAPNSQRRFRFSKVIYQDQYSFGTVAALARFMGKSETQVRRYLEEPEKHDLKLVS